MVPDILTPCALPMRDKVSRAARATEESAYPVAVSNKIVSTFFVTDPVAKYLVLGPLYVLSTTEYY